jgi:hypothetical protein
VSTAAEVLGHRGNIHLPFAAQADTKSPIGKFTKENCNLHIGHGKRVIHQALAIFLASAEPMHLLLRYANPRQRTFPMQIRQRSAQQAHLAVECPK